MIWMKSERPNKRILLLLLIAVFLLVFDKSEIHFDLSGISKNIKSIVHFANIIIALVTVVTLFLVLKSNQRANKLFVGQNMPQIDVTPIGVAQNPKGSHVTTFLS